MESPIVRLHAVRGMTWAWSVERLVDPDGNPLDLSGFDLLMRVRRRRGDPAAIIELSSSDGRLATPAAGLVVGEVDGDAMLAFPDVDHDEEYWHSLVAINVDARIQVWHGPVLVAIDPTRPWSS